MPLLEAAAKPLGLLGQTAASSLNAALIHKKLGSRNHTTIITSNDDIQDLLKVVKSLEDSGILLDRITENEVKEQKSGF